MFRREGIPDALFQLQPPDPYSLLLPDEVIQDGDIRFNLHDHRPDASWEPVDTSEIGDVATTHSWGYARIYPPAGYRLREEDSLPGAYDLLWNSAAGQWLPAEEGLSGIWVTPVRTEPVAVNEQGMPALPPHHRQLWPGESLRRKDKIWRADISNWVEVPGERLNDRVRKEEGLRRFAARPVSTTARSWYVCEATGKANNTGGFMDPFPSAEIAARSIADSHETLGLQPCGVIYHKSGDPLSVFDLPEETFTQLASPPGAATAAEATPQTAAAPAETKKPVVRANAHRQSGKKRSPAAPEGYRLLQTHEELRAEDIVWGESAPGVPGWIPAPPAVQGLEHWATDHIGARKIVEAPAEAAIDLLLIAVKQLKIAADAIEQLATQLKDNT